MKNTGKIFGIIAFAALILFMAACATSAPGGASTPDGSPIPSGTYKLTEAPSCTITFSQNNFTMFVPALISPTGQSYTTKGTFTVSGKYLSMTVNGVPTKFIIMDDETLVDDDDGSMWKK